MGHADQSWGKSITLSVSQHADHEPSISQQINHGARKSSKARAKPCQSACRSIARRFTKSTRVVEFLANLRSRSTGYEQRSTRHPMQHVPTLFQGCGDCKQGSNPSARLLLADLQSLLQPPSSPSATCLKQLHTWCEGSLTQRTFWTRMCGLANDLISVMSSLRRSWRAAAASSRAGMASSRAASASILST